MRIQREKLVSVIVLPEALNPSPECDLETEKYDSSRKEKPIKIILRS